MPKPEGFGIIGRAGFPVFTNMRNCAHVVSCMADYRAFREDFLKIPTINTKPAKPAGVVSQLAKAGATLTEVESKQVLAAYGVSMPREILAVDADAAVEAAKAIDGPVALKIQSPDIIHKTEADAVALGVEGPDAVRAAFQAVMGNARAYNSDADIHGVLVQPMAPSGREIILGVNRDETFGAMLMVGLGGIYVEVMRDVVFAPAPVRPEEARALLNRLQGIALLRGVRGQPPADIDALVDLMVTISRIADDWREEISEIDLNPVLVHSEGEGLTIVDALIVKSPQV
jgi:acetyltransferase